MVNVYASLKDKAGKSLLTAVTGSDGSMKASVTIPAYLDTLYIDPSYVGLLRDAKAVIKSNNINAVIGGSAGISGDIIAGNPAGRLTTGKNVTGRE